MYRYMWTEPERTALAKCRDRQPCGQLLWRWTVKIQRHWINNKYISFHMCTKYFCTIPNIFLWSSKGETMATGLQSEGIVIKPPGNPTFWWENKSFWAVSVFRGDIWEESVQKAESAWCLLSSTAHLSVTCESHPSCVKWPVVHVCVCVCDAAIPPFSCSKGDHSVSYQMGSCDNRYNLGRPWEKRNCLWSSWQGDKYVNERQPLLNGKQNNTKQLLPKTCLELKTR